MRRITIVILALLMVVSACAPGNDASDSTHSTTGVPGLFAAALQRFDHCDELLSWIKEQALLRVGPWGLEGYQGGPWPMDDMILETSADTTAASEAPAAATRDAGVDYSTTNVQEVGVDEPDIVKTDGNRILAVSEGTLYYVDVSGDRPVLRGQLNLPTAWATELFLSGDKALVMGAGDYSAVRPSASIAPGYGYWPSPLTVIAEIDLTSPEDMKLVKTLTLDGNYLSARMTGDTARVVLRSFPAGLQFSYPEGAGLRAERDAELRNRQIIEQSTIDNWVPYFILEDQGGGISITSEGNLLDCSQAYHPEEFAGFGMLTVLTVDISDGLSPYEAVGVMADGETIYASSDSLYVATNRWVAWDVMEQDAIEKEASGYTSQIHKFDISHPATTSYQATGEVPGHLLSQWSMSEHDEYLRVATTDAGSFWGWSDRDSESYVTILEQRGTELVQVGQVSGLGLGERIYAVRMMGEGGYVVTFRQVDPLYVLDLSQPSEPKVTGELKIPGYSAYLHPLQDGLLLGVGQDATEDGRVVGTQIAVFDVSDPSNPQRIHKVTLEDGSSEVEYDHRAFLYWPQTGLIVVPIQRWSWDESKGEDWFAGAIGFTVGRDGIEKVGTVSHMQDSDWYQWEAQIRRSIVIGDSLYTLSTFGLMQSDLHSLNELEFLKLR